MNDKLGSLADFSLGLANRRQEMRGWKEREAGVFIPPGSLMLSHSLVRTIFA